MGADAFTEKFGKVAVKNSMINMEQWGEALAIQEQTPTVGIELILQKRGYLKANQSQAIVKALEKQGVIRDGSSAPVVSPSAPAPAPALAPRPTMSPAPRPIESSDEEVVFHTPQKSAPAPKPKAPEPEDEIKFHTPQKSMNESSSGLSASPKSSGGSKNASEIERIMKMAKEAEAADLHIKVGSPPIIRQHGLLRTMDLPENKASMTEKFLFSLLNDEQKEILMKEKQVDFCYEIPGTARYRANIFKHQKGYDGSFRIIPAKLRPITDLGLPDTVLKLSHFNQGLALFTGPAGCGKSCTMAAMVDEVNKTRKDNIITMEDPIEYIFQSKGCNIIQREVHTHTKSFANALRASLREDPDVMMIGELRDLETVSLAITAAETGHLVFGTLHTTSAPRTIDRILDVFPPKAQAQIRSMVSEGLRGVVSQQLVPRKDKKGRVLAYEILLVTPAVGNLIREQKTFQIPSVMQTGKKFGMKLMDDVLFELFQKGIITKEEAIFRAEKPARFNTTTTT
ncbi:MAG: type IV pilus twitching motility protein PilT [Planctomycetota bacterium]